MLEELRHDFVSFVICTVIGIGFYIGWGSTAFDTYLIYAILSWCGATPFLVAIFLDIRDLEKKLKELEKRNEQD